MGQVHLPEEGGLPLGMTLAARCVSASTCAQKRLLPELKGTEAVNFEEKGVRFIFCAMQPGPIAWRRLLGPWATSSHSFSTGESGGGGAMIDINSMAAVGHLLVNHGASLAGSLRYVARQSLGRSSVGDSRQVARILDDLAGEIDSLLASEFRAFAGARRRADAAQRRLEVCSAEVIDAAAAVWAQVASLDSQLESVGGPRFPRNVPPEVAVRSALREALVESGVAADSAVIELVHSLGQLIQKRCAKYGALSQGVPLFEKVYGMRVADEHFFEFPRACSELIGATWGSLKAALNNYLGSAEKLSAALRLEYSCRAVVYDLGVSLVGCPGRSQVLTPKIIDEVRVHAEAIRVECE